jgi:hypothetical protein
MVNEPTLIRFKEQFLSTLNLFFAKKNFRLGSQGWRFATAALLP